MEISGFKGTIDFRRLIFEIHVGIRWICTSSQNFYFSLRRGVKAREDDDTIRRLGSTKRIAILSSSTHIIIIIHYCVDDDTLSNFLMMLFIIFSVIVSCRCR